MSDLFLNPVRKQQSRDSMKIPALPYEKEVLVIISKIC